ncbi:hypothetical protein Pint_17809 [Pistacia integerrima]|uniref:Uncharacterized protein n=1 Tax=Pistacia integerrima TaxID=434235 RepID=A0ACC0Z0Q5_9ROSI|nr:hypothetical protein Pint_17809 [Pistacia integerrima]
MSPAAATVEFHSPFTIKPSSFVQNPNSNPNFDPCSSSGDHLQNQPNTTNSSSSSSTAFGFGVGVGVRCGTRSRTGSVRNKPRLLKVRKQVGRSRNEASETASDFNPFRSQVEDSGSINGNSYNSSFSSNGVLENTNSVSNKFSFDNDNVGFVFGAKKSDVGKVSESELEKLDKMGLVFDDGGCDFCLNLKSEKGESSESAKNKNPDSENVDFVFGVNGSGMGSSSNSEKRECCRNVGDSGFGFVFGSSWHNSMSNVNSEERECCENNGTPVSDDQGNMKVQSEIESEKVEANEARFKCNESFSCREDYGKGAFVFGADNKKSFGNDNSIERTVNDNVDFNLCYESKFVSESSSSINNMVGASSTSPVFKLPDEMKKLNINECENDDGADRKYDSNKNSCAHGDSKFVFTSGVKPSSSFSVDSNPTQEQISGIGAAVGTKVEDKCGTVDSNHTVFGNSCNIKSAPSAYDFIRETASSANNYVPGATSLDGVQKKGENSSQGLGISFAEFITPNGDCFKANPCPELSGKLEFSAKSKSGKDKRSKKTRGKLKQPSFLKKGLKQVHVQKEGNLQENPTSPECYSPMDFSPYVEATMSDMPLRETLVRSNESFHTDNSCATSTSHHCVTTDFKDGNLASAERFDINIGDQNCRQPNKESYGHHPESSHDGDCSLKGFDFGSETAYSSFNQEQVYCSSGSTGPSVAHADGLNTNIPENVPYCFASGVEEQKYFTFSASSTAEGGLTSRRRLLRKKTKKRAVNGSFIISPSSNVKVSSVHGQEEDRYTSKGEVGTISELAEQVRQGFVSSSASFQEACEVWRQRGNQSYKNGNLSKAEEFYTQGINSAPPDETARCCIKPLVLCYSNRAATKISLGRMREAIEDCLIAANIDPNFLKVYKRAANCHLVLGEVENALHYYNKLLESGPDVCLDRRIIIEAAEGLQKAQKVAECTNRSAKFLEQKTLEAASDALEIIVEALSISSCSEKLLEMKAESLYLLRKYQEAIQLCEQTLAVAEKNFASVGTDNASVNVNASGSIRYSLARLWRWRLISKSYFCLGKLEAALDLLQKLEQVGSLKDKHGSQMLESSISLAATIRELLRRKNAGNEAVRSGRYAEAVEHYTTALSSNIESRPFAAICFCNRAAALQALGQIADAIADCSLAMALDGNYTKAVSRRAVLHEMIRDYIQAATDLQRLVSILENRSNEKGKQSGSPSRSTGSKEIRQAHRHISLMEEEAKKGVPLDLYLILGVKASDAASDIKKAYRKAALRHHPDKAGQFLARTESGVEGRLWKEIAHEVHKDADRLFKMIGEAYAVLSDPTKRSEYDLEEEIRKAPKESHRSSPYGRPSDAYGFTSRRSANKQYWQENWKKYGNSYPQW